jgi:hypothetical protein
MFKLQCDLHTFRLSVTHPKHVEVYIDFRDLAAVKSLFFPVSS